ncbi:MAG: EamA family transporter [Solirubrobacterales bacterium]|nr:EamA family transporter [Solirubrobacterales bacterium]
MLVIAAATGAAWFADGSDALLAAAAGLAGVTALGCFYRALAIGTMSVVAPISASGVALPVVVGIATGDRPSAVQAVGLAAIVLGVVVASRESHESEAHARASRASILLALLAALGFGSFFALSDPASDGSVVWTLVLVRATALPLVAGVALATRARLPERRLGLGIAGVGLIDLTATALIALAQREGALSTVSVLGSMYPVVTVMLAAAVLKERVRPDQLAGIGGALTGVAMVAAG